MLSLRLYSSVFSFLLINFGFTVTRIICLKIAFLNNLTMHVYISEKNKIFEKITQNYINIINRSLYPSIKTVSHFIELNKTINIY